MKVVSTALEGVYILEPKVFADKRGCFFEAFTQKDFEAQVTPVTFVQDNESHSTSGVIRGMHFQKPPFAQSKLLRCTQGRLLDVVVDLRKGSSTYGKHLAVELSAENRLQLFVPKGFAHGFAVLGDSAVLQYKCDEYYHPESEGGVNALSLGIDWGVEVPVLSEKDEILPDFNELISPFE